MVGFINIPSIRFCVIWLTMVCVSASLTEATVRNCTDSNAKIPMVRTSIATKTSISHTGLGIFRRKQSLFFILFPKPTKTVINVCIRRAYRFRTNFNPAAAVNQNHRRTEFFIDRNRLRICQHDLDITVRINKFGIILEILIGQIAECPVLVKSPNNTIGSLPCLTESDMIESVINPLILDIIIQYHAAEKNIRSIAVIYLIAVFVAESQHPCSFYRGRIGCCPYRLFNLQDRYRQEIEPDGFAPGETQRLATCSA